GLERADPQAVVAQTVSLHARRLRWLALEPSATSLIPVVWSDRCLLHEPGGEVWIGVRIPGDEVPERVVAIRDALVEAGARAVPAEPHGDEALLAVHDRSLLDYLASAWDDWVAAGFPDDPGQTRVVPYIFPHVDLRPRRVPAAMSARPGWFAYDTMTPIGPG